MQSDGSYERRKPKKGRRAYNSQEAIYKKACQAVEQAKRPGQRGFQAHLAPSSR
jgi:hypothetical protein